MSDGPCDGGIDAYYIDGNRKVIYIVQSKFRQSERNFEEKGIDSEDLLRMDIDRILDGEQFDESGRPYNSKILQMIRNIQRRAVCVPAKPNLQGTSGGIA